MNRKEGGLVNISYSDSNPKFNALHLPCRTGAVSELLALAIHSVGGSFAPAVMRAVQSAPVKLATL
jgi:hypothetical protein